MNPQEVRSNPTACTLLARAGRALLGVAVTAATGAAALEVEALWRVSVTSDGAQALDPRPRDIFGLSDPRLSADGTRVAFVSASANLVDNDTNRAPDAFVHVLATGETLRVSVASDGAQAAHGPYFWGFEKAAIADVGAVAFTSWSSNLVAGDTNGSLDVFVRQLPAGPTERVSVTSDGAEGISAPGAANAVSYVSITPDARFVLFQSRLSDLVPNDTNGLLDVFVHDRLTRETSLTTIDHLGVSQGGRSPDITPDGRYVAFESPPTGLQQDIYVKDRVTGDLWLESLDNDGRPLNASDAQMGGASISDDGRFVVFHSDDAKLMTGRSAENVVALRDRWLQTTTPVIDDAYHPVISGDGRFVAAVLQFCMPRQVVVHDRLTAQTIRVSVAPDGRFGNGSVEGDVEMSRDGRLVAFRSTATNLVAADTNRIADIFVARIGDGHGPRGSFSDPTTDTDRDGTADECDGDDDADGMPDEFEARYSLNALNAGDSDLDADQDGLTNLTEYRRRSDPTSTDSDQDGASDGVDNCTIDANADQANFDGDAHGDTCDVDDDNDRILDVDDPTPRGGATGSVGGSATPPSGAVAQAEPPTTPSTNPAGSPLATTSGGGSFGMVSLLLLLVLASAKGRIAAARASDS